MDPSESKTPMFKYVLYPGNNAAGISQALAKRKVWAQLSPQKILMANLVWKPLNFPRSLYDQFDEILRYDRDRHVMLNHFENNILLSTKPGLVKSLKHYYSHQNSYYEQNYHAFQTMPTTFIVNPNKDNSELKDFLQRFADIESKNYIKQKMPDKHLENNIWYIKPEAANQGRGIALTNSLKEIETIIFSKSTNTSYIVQKAIQRPLLYKNRKFDVRIWALVTSNFQIYFYKVGYMRTTSYEYDNNDFRQQVHLTNNFQQKKKNQYSKFQDGNTIDLKFLRQELIAMGKTDTDQLMNKIMQRMKSLVIDCFMSVRKLFLRNVKKKQFELFGFDFLIDQDLRTWLIQVNNNPYLGTPNAFIKQLMPQMINQMFQIILDPLFPPSSQYIPFQNKNFQLIHKEINFYRINPLRSGSSDNRKNYYPLNKEQGSFGIKSNYSSKKNRRNSQGLTGLNSFQSTQKHIKVRYSTPAQSIRYLLDTYCFSDLQPFLVPVNFLLTSPKLQDPEQLQVNIKNIKMISQTRICHILLEKKFLPIAKSILLSQRHPEEIKTCILNGYFNAIRNHKNRVQVIHNIIPTYRKILKIHNKDLVNSSPEQKYKNQVKDIESQQQQQKLEEKQEKQTKQQESKEESDPLVQSMILLLIRLGGMINRKVFIPGQTRQKQISREYFINSGTLKILMYFKQQFPTYCKNQIQEFLSNFNSKDWQAYEHYNQKSDEVNMFNSAQNNNTDHAISISDRSMTESQLDHKFCLNLNIMDDKKQRSTYRQRFETQNVRNFARQNLAPLPKIKK